jgi:hypothetical protein
MQSSTPQVISDTQPKKSNTPLIIGIVVAVLLCCCCLIVAGGGFYLTRRATSAVNEKLTSMPDFLTSLPSDIMTSMPEDLTTPEPSSPGATESSPSDSTIPADTIPQGGLGDEIQRAQAWTYSVLAVVTSGCNVPVAKDTKIEVTQQPDSAGVWKERWTVACDGASAVAVDVTFTPSSNGITDVKVDVAK